jgi:hypothetical protein
MAIRSVLHFLADRICRHRLIADRVDKSSPYLSRYYIFGGPATRWFLALHNIHKSDADFALHNHPWPYLACQLAGVMFETTPSGTYKRRPGYLRWKSRASLHRLALPPGRDVWSLFLGGPRAGSWGFNIAGRIVDHKDYLT